MQADDIPDPNCTITVYTEKTRVVGFISEWINAYTFISRKYCRPLLSLRPRQAPRACRTVLLSVLFTPVLIFREPREVLLVPDSQHCRRHPPLPHDPRGAAPRPKAPRPQGGQVPRHQHR